MPEWYSGDVCPIYTLFCSHRCDTTHTMTARVPSNDVSVHVSKLERCMRSSGFYPHQPSTELHARQCVKAEYSQTCWEKKSGRPRGIVSFRSVAKASRVALVYRLDHATSFIRMTKASLRRQSRVRSFTKRHGSSELKKHVCLTAKSGDHCASQLRGYGLHCNNENNGRRV